jgi:hypothetical protein
MFTHHRIVKHVEYASDRQKSALTQNATRKQVVNGYMLQAVPPGPFATTLIGSTDIIGGMYEGVTI